MLPWTPDADYISTADVAVLAALVSLTSDSGTVDPGLIRMGWSARPAVLTTLLPGSTKRLPELVTLHECVLGLAMVVLGTPSQRQGAPALSAWRRMGPSAELAIGQPQP